MVPRGQRRRRPRCTTPSPAAAATACTSTAATRNQGAESTLALVVDGPTRPTTVALVTVRRRSRCGAAEPAAPRPAPGAGQAVRPRPGGLDRRRSRAGLGGRPHPRPRRRRGPRPRWPTSWRRSPIATAICRAMLDEHFELVAHRIDGPTAMSPARRRLVGAYFTQEYAVEAAALCNPSIVRPPRPERPGRRASSAS